MGARVDYFNDLCLWGGMFADPEAERAGIERVVLPERNRRDIEEISSDLLDVLELPFVGTIDEALEQTLCEAPSN